MPDILRSIAFDGEMLLELGDFNCGDEPFQRELADWLLREASNAVLNGTKVWVYINSAVEIVGYSSLGISHWRFPSKKSDRVPVAVIPALAIRKEYWGKPEGVSSSERYSSQIMSHILREANQLDGLRALGLFVHPDNVAAIRVYERFDFRKFHAVYKDRETDTVYTSYLRPIESGG